MTEGAFDYFVVLAGMRTGSNLLEEYLSAMPGVSSHGELFNPHFFGRPKETSQFGFTLETRDNDPIRVISALRAGAEGLPGFRLFYDHDPRVIDHVLRDPRAAKIVLSRRPVESYVSLKIARKTGQWWLGDMTSARAAKVPFDAGEYADFLNTLSGYQDRIRHLLQTTGQTAFYIDYADLHDADVIAGLGRFLGAGGPPDMTRVRAKVQNPKPVADRLTNPEAAETALRNLALPDLGHIPSHEPDRGPGLRLFQVCKTVPLLYMPIRGAGHDPVPEWMKGLDPDCGVESGMSQKEMRRWMRQHQGHRSFTVLRHPLPRAYDAFCRNILPADIEAYADIRHALIARYDVPLPPGSPGEDWTAGQQGAAFLAFLKFLAGNLGGQTSLRVDHSWASQEAFLLAIARFMVPDRVVREDTMADELGQVAASVGLGEVPGPAGGFSTLGTFALEAIRTPEIDMACEKAYRRDYIFFGFETWGPPSQAA